MHPLFLTPPLSECSRRLARVAAGKESPDLIIHHVRPLCVFTEKILPESQVWIASGRIAAIQPAELPASAPETFDGAGAILAPGLIDPHIHIESSMMTACAYAEAALINGTTTIFCDSHEIANVCDVAGVEWMLEDARQAPLNIFLTVPSTVPATTSDIETAGGDLTPEKIGALFDRWPEALALGEKMDFVAVASADPRSHAILAEALRRGRPVSGHVYGRNLVAPYAASGVTDTHEAISGEIAEDLLRAGVWIFLRGGNPATPWNSLPEAIRAVTEFGCSPKRVCICTDDRDADDLFLFGLDWVQREARQFGLAPALAWSLGSLHPATRFALDSEIGSLGLGRRADLALTDDHGNILATWLGGKLVAQHRAPTPLLEQALAQPYRYPPAAYQTVHLPPDPCLVPSPPDQPVIAHLIDIVSPGIETRHGRLPLDGGQSWSEILCQHDLCHVAVIERHGRSGNVAHGLLRGFGLRDGAVASTVGHDAHNLIVAGMDADSMRLAVETLRASQGGVCVIRNQTVKAHVALPIAGLIHDGRATEIAALTAALKQAWTEAGCRLPYMGFNLLPLAVIPELRITDRGLVEVDTLALLPLFEPLP